MSEHILNRETVRFLFDLATRNRLTALPDECTLMSMVSQGWIKIRAGKRPTITPKGEIILALLKAKVGVP